MGDAGERVSDYLYPKEQSRPRAPTTGEQRSREEAQKKKVLPSPPQSLLLITIDLHFLNYRPRSTSTLPQSPRSSTSKMLFVFAKREVFKETKGALKFLRSGRKVWASSVVFTVDISPVPALYDFHMCDLYGCSQVRIFSFTA